MKRRLCLLLLLLVLTLGYAEDSWTFSSPAETTPRHSFRLVGALENGVAIIRTIEITRDGETIPFQVIESLSAESPLVDGEPLFVLEDMNFDGHPDFRLPEFLPAGPNVPYLYWLYDPETNTFERNTALETITAPEFDPDTQTIRSMWRDSANVEGEDSYRFEDGEPLLFRRERRLYVAEGVYDEEIYEIREGQLQLISRMRLYAQ